MERFCSEAEPSDTHQLFVLGSVLTGFGIDSLQVPT